VIFQNFEVLEGILKKKSRTLQEAWEPVERFIQQFITQFGRHTRSKEKYNVKLRFTVNGMVYQTT